MIERRYPMCRPALFVAFIALVLLSFLPTGTAVADERSYPAQCRTTAVLNVRSSANRTSSRIGRFVKGEEIVVHEVLHNYDGDWGAVTYNERQGYVCMDYVVYLQPLAPSDGAGLFEGVGSFLMSLWGSVWGVLKWILLVVGVIIVLALYRYIIEIAVVLGIYAGIGALIFYFAFDNAGLGAIIGLVVCVLLFLRRFFEGFDGFGFSINGFFRVTYYIFSFPIYMLNQLEHFLVAPWRYLFRSDWPSESLKPFLRYAMEALTILLYIATTPLRLFNAVVYNILLHCVSGLYDLFYEVFVPVDPYEGSDSVWRWLLMFPWRFVKYPLYHGLLAVIESVVFTVIDVLLPARTFYHGSCNSACQAIMCDPHRNRYLRNMSLWSSGNFLSSTDNDCSWAGLGVYFAINRSLALSYSYRAGTEKVDDPVILVCRVTPGRIIHYSLLPHKVYRQTGMGGKHSELNKFADAHGYTTGEWFNHRGHWEYCLFDWRGGYNDPWRIRPIYIYNVRTGRIQHIRGGMQHWLFDHTVWSRLMN
ncbi:MAG: SH3 domain-containing protein [Bacteroidales bacterium]|nr:SH3 domain-containing protein [Bacteroidales bacterium]